MIKGTGVDIMLISRMEKSIKSEAFLKKVFSESERVYIKDKANQAQTAAGMFCAKEAVLKAMGKGIGDIPLREIEILHRESGAPFVEMGGAFSIHISISHMGDAAVAMAVLEEKE